MIKNIGFSDRLIRFIIGVILVGGAFLFKSTSLALFGLFTLYEAVASWCILYQLIGRNTCPINASHPKQKIPILKYYLTGIGILLTALMLNLIANYLGWFTWNHVFSSPNSLAQISLDNWLYMLFFYPLTLAIVGITISNKK